MTICNCLSCDKEFFLVSNRFHRIHRIVNFIGPQKIRTFCLLKYKNQQVIKQKKLLFTLSLCLLIITNYFNRICQNVNLLDVQNITYFLTALILQDFILFVLIIYLLSKWKGLDPNI